MAIKSGAKNAMLQGLKDYNHSGQTAFKVAAVDSDGGVYSDDLTYETPGATTIGVMNIVGTPVLNIAGGKTISKLYIYKGTGTNPMGWFLIAEKTIPSEVFTYAGTITITSATITLSDA